jgi:signal transduction histidine kinase
VRVSMLDTGPGLPAGTEDMVFEPFYTTKPGGMGMGLSIVRSILEAHGGSIRAANHEGRGAIFEFELPVDGDQAS